MKSLRLAFAGFGIWVIGACGQDAIHLKTRTLRPGVEGPRTAHPRVAERSHFLIQFREYPGESVRNALGKRGIRVTGYVPDNTLMVYADRETDLEGLDIRWAGSFDAADKLSPQLAAALSSVYLVIFHSDADMNQARSTVHGLGFDLIANPRLLSNHLLVSGSYSQLMRLAEEDAVAYILPASADLVTGGQVAACAGAVTQAGRVAEYVEEGNGWSKDASGQITLGYRFESLTEKMDESAVRGEVERAFREWEKYAPIQLTESQQADALRTIAIQFAQGPHGDDYPFDGPGGMLAHTFYPSPPNSEPSAGDMHLDADEAWGQGAGVDLYSVVLHETGHALGLGHSDMPGAVMYPYYRVTGGLSADDIAGIQALYGASPADPGTPAPGGSPAGPALPPPAGPTAPTEPSGPALPPPDAPSQPPSPGVPSAPAPPANPVPPTGDRTPPALAVVSPASTIVSTSAAAIMVSGTAADNTGVAVVKWSTSNGDAGTASGTNPWTATVPMLIGTNVVTVRAYDAAGNSSWRAVTVVRR